MAGIWLVFACVSCGGGGIDNTPIAPGAPTTILLSNGGGAVFPVGSFAGATDVLVTEELTKNQRSTASFPADSGALLGGTRIEVPDGVALAQNITVMIGLEDAVPTNTRFTIFSFNSATGMWETTEAAVASVRGISAQGQVSEGKVVAFSAPTTGTTGLTTAYGVFAGYQDDNGGTNHIPTVTLTASKPDPGIAEEITLTAVGADADSNPLTFTWLAPGATLGTPAVAGTTATVTWLAAAAGSYVASVSCSDGQGGVATAAVTIGVGIANDAPVWTESGTPPVALKGDVSHPYNTQKIKFTATATDANGDPLTVTWTDNTGATDNFTEPVFDAETGMAAVYWKYGTVGAYTITATVADGRGGTDVATKDVTLDTLPTDFSVVGYATCGGCHTDKVTKWQTTNHSMALEKSINVDLGHGYRNEACYNCHAAGRWPVGSGGFIDQELTPQFANIQCESCHGMGQNGMGAGHKPITWDPGKGYVKDANGKYVPDANGAYLLDASYDGSEGYGCGLCHEGSRHGAFEEWNKSGHANYALTEDDNGTEVVGPAGEASCVKCHNGQYFVSIQIDGGDPPAANLEVADMVPYAMNINCATCHDTHEATNEKQLRVSNTDTVIVPFDDTPVNAGWGNICMKCHNGRRTRTDYNNSVAATTSRGPHGNAQGALFFGLMGADFGGTKVAYDTDHPHRTWNENTCITCHMYRQPYVDAANPAQFGHEWEPKIERCITCHTNYTVDQKDAFWAWVEEFQTNEIQSRLDAFVAAWPVAWKDVTDPANPVLRNKESAVGAGDGPVVGDAKGDAYREVLWNYKLILSDATKGVHNPTYAEDIMDKSITRLNELNAMP